MEQNIEKSGENLRSWKNLLIDPVFQFTFAGYILIAIALYTAIVIGAVYSYTDQVALIMNDVSDTPDSFIVYLFDQLESLSYQMLGLTLGFVAIVLTIIVIETHRIAGASYAIRKFVTENLEQENYSQRLTLRKRDYFTDLADSINRYCSKKDPKQERNAEKPVA